MKIQIPKPSPAFAARLAMRLNHARRKLSAWGAGLVFAVGCGSLAAQEVSMMTAEGTIESFGFGKGAVREIEFQSRPQDGDIGGTRGSFGVRPITGWQQYAGGIRWVIQYQHAIRPGAVTGGRYLFTPGNNGILRYTRQAPDVPASQRILTTSGQGGFGPVPAGFSTSALRSWRDRIYWGEVNGTRVQIWSCGHELGDFNLCQAEAAAFSPPGTTIRKLEVLYETDAGTHALALTTHGDLYLFRLDAPFVVINGPAPLQWLAGGVTDFDWRRESMGAQHLNGIYYTVGHTGQPGGPPAALWHRAQDMFTGALGAATLLYTSRRGMSGEYDTLTEVAVGDEKLFLRSVPMTPFGAGLFADENAPGRATRRAAIPYLDPPPPPVFEAIPADGKNLLVKSAYLYFSRGQTIYRVDADVAPLPVVNLDFEAVGVEITQTVQTLDHRVALISGKRTFVRGYARERENSGTGLTGFQPKAQLRVYRRGAAAEGLPEFEVPGSPLYPRNAPMLPGKGTTLSALRANPETSYLWELPASMIPSEPVFLRVVMELRPGELETRDPANPTLDPGLNNTVGSVHASITQGVIFVPVVRPCLLFIPVKTIGEYYTNRELIRENLSPFLNRALSYLPARQLRHWIAADLFLKSGRTDPRFPGCYDMERENSHALHFGIGIMNMLYNDPPGAPDCHFVGVVHDRAQVAEPDLFGPTRYRDSVFNGVGNFGESSIVSLRQGSNGVPDFPAGAPHGGNNIAHELGHNWDQDHVDCGNPDGPDYDYPYNPCLTGPGVADVVSERFGYDPISNTALTEMANGDIMSYRDRRWTSDYTWSRLIIQIDQEDGTENAPLPAVGQAAPETASGAALTVNPAADYFLLNGMYRASSGEASLLPVAALPAADVSARALRKSLAAAAALTDPVLACRQRNADGISLDESPVVLEEGHQQTGDGLEGISQFIEVVPGAARLEIFEVATNRIVAGAVASAHAPSAVLSEPEVDLVNQRLRMTWTAADADGDELTFILLYKPDDGPVQRLLRTHMRDLSADIDLSMLPSGEAGRLRLLVSDGFHSTLVDSAPFVVPPHAPVLTIHGLTAGQQVDPWSEATGPGVVVSATAVDVDEGPETPGLNVQWTWAGPQSGGQTGETLTIGKWLPGDYVLTASTVDATGLTAEAGVSFTVVPPVVPESPAAVVLDGVAPGPESAGAPYLTWPLSNGTQASARLTHREGALFVHLEGMSLTGPEQFGAIMIDADGNGSAGLEAGDLTLEIKEDGALNFWTPSAPAGWARAAAPASLIEVAVFPGETHWSAEIRIPDNVIGGWNHAARIRPYVATAGEYPYDSYPIGSDHHGPSTWLPVSFGPRTAPDLQAPVAKASGGGSFAPAGLETFWLKADGSVKSDGSAAGLTYAWTQTGGPAVTLQDAATAVPRFSRGAVSAPVVLTFQVVVNDGVLDSNSAEVELYFYPPPALAARAGALTDSGGVFFRRLADGRVEGVFDATHWFRDPAALGAMPAGGAVFTVETSVDLTDWETVIQTPASPSGMVRFTDDTAINDAKRFYRLRQ